MGGVTFSVARLLFSPLPLLKTKWLWLYSFTETGKYTRWPEAKSESKNGKNDGRVDEVEDADGENEGSCLTAAGDSGEEEGQHHHQI